jgi:hypothetical protein
MYNKILINSFLFDINSHIKTIHQNLFSSSIPSDPKKLPNTKQTFNNSLLLVKSYLLTHGYKDTLEMLDANFKNDDILKSPKTKSKSKMGFFSRRNKGRKSSSAPLKEEGEEKMWSLEDKSELRKMLVERKEFESVKAMLEEQEDLNEVAVMNLNLRIFLQRFGGLDDENQKIILMDEHRDFFSNHKDDFVIGCKYLKGTCVSGFYLNGIRVYIYSLYT